MRELPNDFYDARADELLSQNKRAKLSRFYLLADDFCRQTADFFKEYSLYEIPEILNDSSEKIFISPFGFALLIKRIFDLSNNADEFIPQITRDNENLFISFKLDTSSIENFLYREMSSLASLSGLGFKTKPGEVTFSAEIIKSELINIYAGKIRLVLSALKDLLMNPIYKKI